MGVGISSVRIRRRRSGTKPPKSVLSATLPLSDNERVAPHTGQSLRTSNVTIQSEASR